MCFISTVSFFIWYWNSLDHKLCIFMQAFSAIRKKYHTVQVRYGIFLQIAQKACIKTRNFLYKLFQYQMKKLTVLVKHIIDFLNYFSLKYFWYRCSSRALYVQKLTHQVFLWFSSTQDFNKLPNILQNYLSKFDLNLRVGSL